MKLSALMERAQLERGKAGDANVTGFAIDHRKVAPGTVFGAFRGAQFNAEDVIKDAVEAGAVAVVARPEADVDGALHVASGEPRQTFAKLASGFFAPFPQMIVAITGTNGKTSTAEMTRQIWRMCGERAASIGTLGVTTPDGSVSTGLTTPDIVTFLSNISGLAREGVSHVAYEASSHGLSQYRNEGVAVSACAFTNFSRDHLDYHGTMEAYFEAKMRLFDDVIEPDAPVVIWRADDSNEWTGKAIEHARARDRRVLVVGEAEGQKRDTFLRLVHREPTQLGQVLRVEFEGEERSVKLPLIGAYQAANALCAASLALATGSRASQVFDAVSRLQPVRGRLERAVITQQGAPVYIDYAHTPDALEAAIAALRPHVDAGKGGRLIVVFGAGGDRDTGKRAPMGDVAARMADLVIVTDDNPRGEDPSTIRSEIMRGVTTGEARDIADRRKAIAAAIADAGAHDIILVAGKGHEQGQIIGSGDNMRVLAFDDVTVARECAAEIGSEST